MTVRASTYWMCLRSSGAISGTTRELDWAVEKDSREEVMPTILLNWSATVMRWA